MLRKFVEELRDEHTSISENESMNDIILVKKLTQQLITKISHVKNKTIQKLPTSFN